jgi:hypothetical protein
VKRVDVTCPVCAMHWSIETPRSWWLSYDRCYGCLADATEANRLRTGVQLSLLEA